MDRLLLHGMVFFGRHGDLDAERRLGARFVVDVDLEAELEAAGRSDRLADSVDYVSAYEAVREVVEGEPRRLLEAVAERIAERMLAFDRVRTARVRVWKRPPVEGQFERFGVEVVRGR